MTKSKKKVSKKLIAGLTAGGVAALIVGVLVVLYFTGVFGDLFKKKPALKPFKPSGSSKPDDPEPSNPRINCNSFYDKDDVVNVVDLIKYYIDKLNAEVYVYAYDNQDNSAGDVEQLISGSITSYKTVSNIIYKNSILSLDVESASKSLEFDFQNYTYTTKNTKNGEIIDTREIGKINYDMVKNMVILLLASKENETEPPPLIVIDGTYIC